MIETLRIQNFKGWEDTGEIQLAPLTVFFGENSSGKSSIGQFLMMLKQSMESSDRKTVFITGSEETSVDLGSPLDIIFDQNPENTIRFSYNWTSKEKLILKDPSKRERRSSDHVKFSGEVYELQDVSENRGFTLPGDASGIIEIEWREQDDSEGSHVEEYSYN